MSSIVVLILRIALLVSLYAFLGWAMYVLWKDIRAQGNLISAPQIPLLFLTPAGGGEQECQKFAIPEIVLGRNTNNEYPIANETISSRHARLSYHHNQWWLEDLNSTNGTFLNDERVSVPTIVVPGDELRIGDLSLMISIGDKEK